MIHTCSNMPTTTRHGGETRKHAKGANPLNSSTSSLVYKIYKRRWFGLAQLTVLNIIVGWNVSIDIIIIIIVTIIITLSSHPLVVNVNSFQSSFC